MRRFVRALPAVAALALVGSQAMVSMAQAETQVTVSAGESIQAAIDAAGPNTVINVESGTYTEQLLIQKDNIQLVGDDVNLVAGGEAPEGSPCASPDPSQPETTGICVAGDWQMPASPDDFPTLQRRVSNVRVDGFHVDGFSYGVFGFGVDHLTVENVVATDNEEYGIFSNTSVSSNIRHNMASGSDEAGIYVGDSPDANAEVAYNEVFDNELGLFIRDSRSGTVRQNFSHGNCVGLLFLDTGAPSPSGDFKVEGNLVNENNKVCAPNEDEGTPPLSGSGIVVLGSDNNVFRSNSVVGNTPASESPFGGGLVFASSEMFGGSTAEHNDVRANILTDNEPADVVYESAQAQASNVVVANLGGTTHVMNP